MSKYSIILLNLVVVIVLYTAGCASSYEDMARAAAERKARTAEQQQRAQEADYELQKSTKQTTDN